MFYGEAFVRFPILLMHNSNPYASPIFRRATNYSTTSNLVRPILLYLTDYLGVAQ